MLSSGFWVGVVGWVAGSTGTRSLFTPGAEYLVSTALSVLRHRAAAWARLASPLGSKFLPSPLSRPCFQSLSTASFAQSATWSRSPGWVVIWVSFRVSVVPSAPTFSKPP